MRALTAILAVLCLGVPSPATANPVCALLGLCLYLSPGFELVVVDAETARPLSGVYAWAEWVQHGAHGIGGPLMIQDGVSAADGRLAFPGWGPTLGSGGGLLLGTDPAVILFRAGYAPLLLENDVAPGASHLALRRGLSRAEGPVRLQPFRGSPAGWVEQLRKSAYPALSSYVSDAAHSRFRAHYLRRLAVIEAGLTTVPPDTAGAPELRAGLEQSARFFRGDR
jgi:hypothetical protein